MFDFNIKSNANAVETESVVACELQELAALQLAMVGGGICDVTLS